MQGLETEFLMSGRNMKSVLRSLIVTDGQRKRLRAATLKDIEERFRDLMDRAQLREGKSNHGRKSSGEKKKRKI